MYALIHPLLSRVSSRAVIVLPGRASALFAHWELSVMGPALNGQGHGIGRTRDTAPYRVAEAGMESRHGMETVRE